MASLKFASCLYVYAFMPPESLMLIVDAGASPDDAILFWVDSLI